MWYNRKWKGRDDMASIFDVAKYVLEKQGPMSTWKLEKLCYYAQAWTLAWTEKELFPEEFEAWKNGPVCPELFAAHKGLFVVGKDSIRRGDAGHLTDEQRENVDAVLEHYGSWEPHELREKTHAEGPWKTTRDGLPETAPSNRVISKAAMGLYYGGL